LDILFIYLFIYLSIYLFIYLFIFIEDPWAGMLLGSRKSSIGLVKYGGSQSRSQVFPTFCPRALDYFELSEAVPVSANVA